MKPTLNQVFLVTILGLAGTLAALYWIVFDGSRRTVEESSENIRDAASREISDRVMRLLNKAPEVEAQFERELAHGLFDPRNPAAIEPALSALLLSDPDLGEVTLTSGRKTGVDKDGNLLLAPAPREQWSIFRSPNQIGVDQIWSRHVHQAGDEFISDRRVLDPANALQRLPSFREPGKWEDPTLHYTFSTPTRQDLFGELLPSDLHWSQIDAALPESQRRVEFSVQKAIAGPDGEFLGVVRVGLLARQLDEAMRLKLTAPGNPDPHVIFLCDKDGRLLTRISPRDQIREFDDDLRVSPVSLPAQIKTALANPKIAALSSEAPVVSGRFTTGGEAYSYTFRELQGTRDWVVGIVVPESFYLGKLTALREHLLCFSLSLMSAIVILGGLILRSVKRAQDQIAKESLKMNAFTFSPTPVRSAFRDVANVLESLEKAKTAMRAMSKYAPVDLVRRLYEENQEPVIGGQPMEISIMFTDIKGFTTLSEKIPANDLAASLGLYLDAMARVIQQQTRGTIDKYIGDAIMAFWNAPAAVENHARMACAAALRCHAAGIALAESPEWRGMPPFETRFGLHCGTALVGHFGARDRLNYTALGDTVNLASRLEGLNKIYGTTILVSEMIARAAEADFHFRLVDIVAVQGKSQAVRIYELLGAREDNIHPPEDPAKSYEKAFALYLGRDFESAAEILQAQACDGPSGLLLDRCRAYCKTPPPADWDGIFVALTK